jgi:membrane protein YdbS with pleckstrin-like domain
MDETFSNAPLLVDHLPRLADDAFVSVDRRYVWGTLAGVCGAIAAVTGGAALIMTWSDAVVVPIVIAGVLIAVFAAVGIVALVESRRLAYQLRERDLSLRSGAFRHRVETIPFSRIQHVSVGRGVIERTLGLATLQVSSAGPDFSVPGLTPTDAELIKAAIAARAADHVEHDDPEHDDPEHDDPEHDDPEHDDPEHDDVDADIETNELRGGPLPPPWPAP